MTKAKAKKKTKADPNVLVIQELRAKVAGLKQSNDESYRYQDQIRKQRDEVQDLLQEAKTQIANLEHLLSRAESRIDSLLWHGVLAQNAVQESWKATVEKQRKLGFKFVDSMWQRVDGIDAFKRDNVAIAVSDEEAAKELRRHRG